jgi:hypothetical protein
MAEGVGRPSQRPRQIVDPPPVSGPTIALGDFLGQRGTEQDAETRPEMSPRPLRAGPLDDRRPKSNRIAFVVVVADH